MNGCFEKSHIRTNTHAVTMKQIKFEKFIISTTLRKLAALYKPILLRLTRKF